MSENWQDFTEKFSSVGFTVKMLIITLGSAVAVGSSWALIGNKLFLQILNYINVIKNILQTYIDVKNNIIITETEYPPEWIQ